MKVVTLFFPELFNTVETMLYFLASDKTLHVRLATSFDGDEKSEHPWALRRIKDFGGVEIVPFDHSPQRSEILAFYLARNKSISDKLGLWRTLASSIVYMSRIDGPIGVKDRIRETVRSFPHYLQARRIRFSPYIHPGLIANCEWLKASFAPIDIDATRRWRLGFLGNRQPPERMRRLARCKAALAGAESRVKWHEYGGLESSVPRGIEPMDYVQVLSDMDFCLSPPGWDWYTHRTVEALVRGSIPVIEDPQVYGLDLADGENCIVAEPHDWGAAVRRVMELTEANILRLRQNVMALRQERLLPEKASHRFRSQLWS
jgi:hypothetical protein